MYSSAKFLIGRPFAAISDLGVHPQRLQGCMTEHLLDQAHIAFGGFEESGGGGVPGRVGGTQRLD